MSPICSWVSGGFLGVPPSAKTPLIKRTGSAFGVGPKVGGLVAGWGCRGADPGQVDTPGWESCDAD